MPATFADVVAFIEAMFVDVVYVRAEPPEAIELSLDRAVVYVRHCNRIACWGAVDSLVAVEQYCPARLPHPSHFQ